MVLLIRKTCSALRSLLTVESSVNKSEVLSNYFYALLYNLLGSLSCSRFSMMGIVNKTLNAVFTKVHSWVPHYYYQHHYRLLTQRCKQETRSQTAVVNLHKAKHELCIQKLLSGSENAFRINYIQHHLFTLHNCYKHIITPCLMVISSTTV